MRRDHPPPGRSAVGTLPRACASAHVRAVQSRPPSRSPTSTRARSCGWKTSTPSATRTTTTSASATPRTCRCRTAWTLETAARASCTRRSLPGRALASSGALADRERDRCPRRRSRSGRPRCGRRQDRLVSAVGTVFASWLGAFLAANLLLIAMAGAAGHGRRRQRHLADVADDHLVPACSGCRTSSMLVVLSRSRRDRALRRRLPVPRPADRRCSGSRSACCPSWCSCRSSTCRSRGCSRTRSTTTKVEERARELWDRAHGGWLVALVLIVAIGAPHRRGARVPGPDPPDAPVAGRTTCSPWCCRRPSSPASTSRPSSSPGSSPSAIVLGLCFQRTGRLGMPIVAHIGLQRGRPRARCHEVVRRPSRP